MIEDYPNSPIAHNVSSMELKCSHGGMIRIPVILSREYGKLIVNPENEIMMKMISIINDQNNLINRLMESFVSEK